MTRLYCDLCGKEIRANDTSYIGYFTRNDGESSKMIDICSECFKEKLHGMQMSWRGKGNERP